MLDETHVASAASWVESANAVDADFPIQNLPYCAYRVGSGAVKLGVGIGDQILDLSAAVNAGLLSDLPADVQTSLQQPTLNTFMAMGRPVWKATRKALFTALSAGNPAASQAAGLLVAQSDVTFEIAMVIGDFTDCECSHHHARRMQLLMSGRTKPSGNGLYLPRAYHGRSSSIVMSGAPAYLPRGQIEVENEVPAYSTCVNFDYELELGIIIGKGNERGHPIKIDDAEDHIFGFNIINDWSARDIQKWERFPLGPFLGKNHGTSISPWIVTMEALAPFRVPPDHVGDDWPDPLPYLDSERNRTAGGVSVGFEILTSSAKMREMGLPLHTNSTNNVSDASWTISQLVTQHSSNGCNLRPGDLIGSGTISGPEPHQSACLFELSEAGKTSRELPSGETRTFLEVGDDVIFKGAATKDGYPRIGFGTVEGRVCPPAIDL